MQPTVLLINHPWFKPELEASGYKVLVAGPAELAPDIAIPSRGLSLEALLSLIPKGSSSIVALIYFDNSGPFLIPHIEKAPFPTIFYSVDTHHHGLWHSYLALNFDKVLIAQKVYQSYFDTLGVQTEIFPLWAPIEYEPCEEKSISVCFRGTLDKNLNPSRVQFIQELAQLVPLDYATGPYTEAFATAKIVVNQAVKDDLNFRVFEAMRGGALLVTPSNCGGLFDLFRDGVHLVTYEANNAQDASQKIHYYLEHEQERGEIANRGFQEVYTAHRQEIRAKRLLEILQNLPISPRSRAEVGQAYALLAAAKVIVESTSLPDGKDLIRAAGIKLSEGLDTNSLEDRDLLMSALPIVSLLEDIEEIDLALSLLSKLAERFPTQGILTGWILVTLKAAGRPEDSERLLKEFFSLEADFGSIERMVEEAKEKIRDAFFHVRSKTPA